MKLVITDNLSFTDYYHGNSQWQCFIANQNQECHCTCQWMTSFMKCPPGIYRLNMEDNAIFEVVFRIQRTVLKMFLPLQWNIKLGVTGWCGAVSVPFPVTLTIYLYISTVSVCLFVCSGTTPTVFTQIVPKFLWALNIPRNRNCGLPLILRFFYIFLTIFKQKFQRIPSPTHRQSCFKQAHTAQWTTHSKQVWLSATWFSAIM